MFDSGISANEVIEEVKSEVDAALPIDTQFYVDRLNETEQLMYSEIIKEERHKLFETDFREEDEGTFTIALSDIGEDKEEETAPVSFTDICGVYHNDIQLLRIDNEYERAGIKNSYRYNAKNDEIAIYVPNEKRRGKDTYIYYNVRPKPKTVDEDSGTVMGNVMLPTEFVYVIQAKLRAEAYKIVNEGAYASNWLSEYNYGIETFKEWARGHRNLFGK